MHLLVTGSSGLIGTALVDAALARGDTVTRMVRSSSGRRPGAAGVTDVTWDPGAGTVDTAGLRAARPVDGVVHLAGAGVGDRRWSASRKAEILDSRVECRDGVGDQLGGPDPTVEDLSLA